jgi:hypothetical protein
MPFRWPGTKLRAGGGVETDAFDESMTETDDDVKK